MTQRDLFTNLKIFILFFYFYIPYYHLHLTRIKPKPLLNSRIKTFVSHGAVGFNKKHMQARTTAPRQWMDLPSRPSFLYASVIRDLVGPRWMNTQNWKLLKTHLVLPSSIVGTLICMAAPQSLPHTKMDTHKKKTFEAAMAHYTQKHECCASSWTEHRAKNGTKWKWTENYTTKWRTIRTMYVAQKTESDLKLPILFLFKLNAFIIWLMHRLHKAESDLTFWFWNWEEVKVLIVEEEDDNKK